MKRHCLFFSLLILLSVYACKKSNNAPATAATSQTFSIGGVNYAVDSVQTSNGGAQIFAFNGKNPFEYSMSFYFHGVPKTGTYDVVDYQTAPGDGQVQVAGFDNTKNTFYFTNAASAAVKVTLTGGRYSIVMKEVTAKVKPFDQNPSGSINLSASFSQQ